MSVSPQLTGSTKPTHLCPAIALETNEQRMAGSLFLSLSIKEQGWRGGVVYIAWQIELIFLSSFLFASQTR